MNFFKRSLVGNFLFLFALVLLSHCTKEHEECVFVPDNKGVSADFVFEQLEDTVANIQSKEELVDFLTRQPVTRDYLLRRSDYPNDSAFINILYQRFTHPGFDTLLLETKRIFGDLSSLKEEFRQAFTNLKYYYPNFKTPKVQTIITGLETDLVVSDTLIIVGLDYYMGKDAKYRPRLYDYLLTRYEPEDIVPSCMLIFGIDGRFNKTDLDDKTVLADMIAYGKSFYFAKHMLPCTPDSVFLWYSAEDILGARANEDLVWARFIQDEILFSKSHVTKQRFLAERPKTLEVGEKCPGRIAQWMGWQIVRKYMETHADKTLPELMEMSNAQQLFKESQYKPEHR